MLVSYLASFWSVNYLNYCSYNLLIIFLTWILSYILSQIWILSILKDFSLFTLKVHSTNVQNIKNRWVVQGQKLHLQILQHTGKTVNQSP